MVTRSKKDKEAIDLTVEEKIVVMYELQKVNSKIDDINRVKGELPLEVQDLEDDIVGLETRILNYTQEIDNINRSVKAKKEDIEQAKIMIKKYEEQQNQVRNNREYDSLSKEIEFQKLEIELCEKHIKEYGFEIKNKKKSIDDAKAILEDRMVDLKEKRNELSSIEEETANEIALLKVKEEELAAKIDDRILAAYHKIRNNVRNGLAVVMVKRDACGGCFNRIPPQRQLDIRLSKKFIVCEYCGRILVSDLLEEEQ